MTKNCFFGTTVAITGASSGLGEELAYRLARYRVHIILIARDSAKLERVADAINATGSTATVIATDIATRENCQKMMASVMRACQRLDFFFLNAGTSMWQKFTEVTDVGYFENLMRVNYFGVLFPLYYGWGYFEKCRTKIIVTLSIQSYVGVPYHTGYGAAKHAVNGFIDALRAEQEIEIVKIIPGWIRGTNLRATSLKERRSDSKETGTTRRPTRSNALLSISLPKSVALIIKKMNKNRKVIYLPSAVRIICWLNYLFPAWMRTRIKRAVSRE